MHKSLRTWPKALVAGVALSAVSLVSASEKLIELGDVVVTQQEFEQVINVIAPEGRAEALLANDRRAREMLVEYFTARVLAEKARDAGMHEDERFKLRQAFEENRALAKMYVARTVDDMPRPDLEMIAKELYQSNPERFETAEQVSAQHILIAINNERSEAEALELAQKVHKDLLDGTPFAELVEEYSDDPSAQQNGGNLGFFSRDRMVKPFADTAFAMDKGDISEPVKTRFGYHIIELIDRKPSATRPFEQVKDELMKEAESTFVENARTEMLSNLRSDPDIKTYHDNVEAMIERQ
ncbi:peptidylprolyl isomerase [Halopseudomonas salegens]|uniref:peptidylprolyl isomerase n=1 Tax=Halopseudomonas salegens TaxID=1434072 RepID=A0A1H2HW23_9GAMM|nr:peptidylprolyl isomerase [Halopseudomonas salegens]SDU35946.1 peptidyl-prolyl cis-trans isomerase C [Halopseudomonas salegens]